MDEAPTESVPKRKKKRRVLLFFFWLVVTPLLLLGSLRWHLDTPMAREAARQKVND